MPPELSKPSRRLAGKPFHRRGPVTAKLLSPKLAGVRGTAILQEEKRRCGRPCSETSRISVVRYVGAVNAGRLSSVLVIGLAVAYPL